MRQIADLRSDDFGACGTCECEELIKLMRADVTQNATVALALKEVRQARAQITAMRAEANRLHHCSDSAAAYKINGMGGGAIFEALAVADRINTPSLGLHSARFVQLFERRKTRLVRHEIFATAHGANAEWCAIGWHRRSDDHVNRDVVEQCGFVFKPRHIWKRTCESCTHRFLMRIAVPANKRRTDIEQALHLAVDMPMGDADDGKSDHVSECSAKQ